jgi:adhesin HecA-like repeat protein
LAGINTKLDADQVIKQAYDEPNQRLRVDATLTASIGDVTIIDPDGDPLAVNPDGSINVNINGGALQVEISAADGDNIAISDGTNTAVVNPDGSLNVQLTGTSEVRITDGTDDLAINADGSLNSVVTATNLDIRDLVFATDKVDVSGSSVSVSGSVAVSATDLDIRDLTHVTDSIKIGDGTDFVNVTSNNELKSADILNVSFTQGTVSVSVAGAAVEIKSGVSRLANRKSVLIQAQGTNIVYGFSSSSQPFNLANGSTITLSVGDGLGVWVDRASGGGSVNVAFAEFA